MSRAERLFIALSSAGATAALGYAAIRLIEAAAFPAPNPAVVIWSERSGFLWRVALALYIGGMGAFGGYALATRSPSTAARLLPRYIAVAASAILAQATILP